MPRKKIKTTSTTSTSSLTTAFQKGFSTPTISPAICRENTSSSPLPTVIPKDNTTSTTVVTRPDIVIPKVTVASISPDGVEPVDTTNFRFQGKLVFITFPQCDTLKEDVAAKIKNYNKYQTEGFVVAQEKHQDGHNHLHVIIKFKRKINIRNANHFDFLAGKHGNVQRVKNYEACVAYVGKDGDYISESIDVPAIIKKYGEKQEKKRKATEKKNILIYQSAIDGKTYDEILMDPSLGPYCVLHGNSVKTLISDLSDVASKRQRVADRPKFLKLRISGQEFDLLKNWNFKEKQFWIYGPPNAGKTTLIRQLKQYGMKGFEIPKNGDFANYHDDKFDFAFIDEFKGQLTIQFLNEFLQGEEMHLNGKYVAGGVRKRKNMPVFILSNFEPTQCFHKVSSTDIQPLLVRLHVFEINSPQDYEIILDQDHVMDLGITDLYCDEHI